MDDVYSTAWNMACILNNYLSMMSPSQATEAELTAGSAPTTPVSAPGWTFAAREMLSIDLASDSEDSHGTWISGYHCMHAVLYGKLLVQLKDCARTMGAHLEVEGATMLFLPHLLKLEGILGSLKWPSLFLPQLAATLPFQILVEPQPLPRQMATRQPPSQGHQLMMPRLQHCLLERVRGSWPARIGGDVVWEWGIAGHPWIIHHI